MPPCAHGGISLSASSGTHKTRGVDSTEVISVELPADEFALITWGLWQWGGPGYCTDAMAVAMGFSDAERMLDEIQLMLRSLKSSRSLTRRDWARALLAVEVVFASDVAGAAYDWEIVTGWTDEDSIGVLRRLQGSLRKVRSRNF